MGLIDADALIHDITKFYCEDCEKRKGIKNGKLKFVYDIGDAPCRACGLDGLKDVIEDAPTIEAEPVKHGKWERIDPNDHNDYRCECSNCKSNWVMEDEIDEYSYCWVCGAKMDLDEVVDANKIGEVEE